MVAVGCESCKVALDHFNRGDFKLPANVVGLYINSLDKEEKLAQYAQKVKIPFTTISTTKEIGEQYGVYAYPTFYLIDEQGVIEAVMEGYRKEFINGLSSR